MGAGRCGRDGRARCRGLVRLCRHTESVHVSVHLSVIERCTLCVRASVCVHLSVRVHERREGARESRGGRERAGARERGRELEGEREEAERERGRLQGVCVRASCVNVCVCVCVWRVYAYACRLARPPPGAPLRLLVTHPSHVSESRSRVCAYHALLTHMRVT